MRTAGLAAVAARRAVLATDVAPALRGWAAFSVVFMVFLRSTHLRWSIWLWITHRLELHTDESELASRETNPQHEPDSSEGATVSIRDRSAPSLLSRIDSSDAVSSARR
jgi:hypothetical protein